MSEDRLTAADIVRMRDAMARAQPQHRPYLAHPSEKAHLDSHGGGKADCAVCVRIWTRLEATR